MEMKPLSIDYSSSGSRISSLNAFSSSNPTLASAQSYLSSTTPVYASSEGVSCSYHIGSGASVGGFVSHDSSKVGGSGYGAGLTLGFKF